MKLSENLKKYLQFEIILTTIIVGGSWISLGTEGMAAKFCSYVHASKCDDVDWSDRYAPERYRNREGDQAEQVEPQEDQGTRGKSFGSGSRDQLPDVG